MWFSAMCWGLSVISISTAYGLPCASNGVPEQPSLLGDFREPNGRSINWYKQSDFQAETQYCVSAFLLSIVPGCAGNSKELKQCAEKRRVWWGEKIKQEQGNREEVYGKAEMGSIEAIWRPSLLEKSKK